VVHLFLALCCRSLRISVLTSALPQLRLSCKIKIRIKGGCGEAQ
jgi:hypothetical protein